MQELTESQCKVCFDNYNTKEKAPITICSGNHNLCLQCTKNIVAPFICPFCRVSITKNTLRLNSQIYSRLGGQENMSITFRYCFSKERLRILPVDETNFVLKKQGNNQGNRRALSQSLVPNTIKALTIALVAYIMINLIMHLFLIFTEEQECIDWQENSNSFTIRNWLKISILINVGTFSLVGLLLASTNEWLVQLVQRYKLKFWSYFMAVKLISEIGIWSYLLFIFEPDCSGFILYYLNTQTFGYYLLGVLYGLVFVYLSVRSQGDGQII